MSEHKQEQGTVRQSEGGAFSSGLDTLTKSLRAVFLLLVVVIGILLVWFFTLSGFFTVKPDTAVITLQFGELKNIYKDSWHWVFPYPVSSIVKIPTKPLLLRSSSFMPANRNLIFDRKKANEGGNAEAFTPGVDGYLLTADACIIHTEWEMVYRISNPEAYYRNCMTPEFPDNADTEITGPDGASYGTRGPQTLLKAVLDNAVAAVTAKWKVNDILYEKTFQYNRDVEMLAAKNAAELGIGVVVENVSLRAKSPPPKTIDAFDEVLLSVQQAESAKEKAAAYATEQGALAKSESTRLIAEAGSYKKRVVSEVIADVVYFRSILKEFKKSPEAVTVSLFTSAVSDAMGGVKDKFILNSVPGGKQELRLKLNPEPESSRDSAKKEMKKEAGK